MPEVERLLFPVPVRYPFCRVQNAYKNRRTGNADGKSLGMVSLQRLLSHFQFYMNPVSREKKVL